MKWLKFREKWAWGYSDWEYQLVSDNFSEVDAKEWCSEKECTYGFDKFSDQLRGIEYEFVDKADENIILQKKKELEEQLASVEAQLEFLNSSLK